MYHLKSMYDYLLVNDLANENEISNEQLFIFPSFIIDLSTKFWCSKVNEKNHLKHANKGFEPKPRGCNVQSLPNQMCFVVTSAHPIIYLYIYYLTHTIYIYKFIRKIINIFK